MNLYAMLTGSLPFMVDPPNNLTKLHSLIMRGCKVPDYISTGKETVPIQQRRQLNKKCVTRGCSMWVIPLHGVIKKTNH